MENSSSGHTLEGFSMPLRSSSVVRRSPSNPSHVTQEQPLLVAFYVSEARINLERNLEPFRRGQLHGLKSLIRISTLDSTRKRSHREHHSTWKMEAAYYIDSTIQYPVSVASSNLTLSSLTRLAGQ